MFAIYDNQGVRFRSTLEELYRVEGIRRSRNVKRISEDGQEESEQQMGSPNREAISAYRQVINARQEEAIYHAYQIMKRPVVTVTDDTSVIDCYNLLEEKSINQVPVLNQQRKPVGLLTKESLLKVILITDNTVSHTGTDTLTDLIFEPMITADPVSDIRRVAQVMYDRGLNCVPITNDTDIIVGIITRTDIIHAVSTYPAIALWA